MLGHTTWTNLRGLFASYAPTCSFSL